MDVDPRRFVVRYSGHVQGVGFRMTAIAQADQLQINGFVRNQPDGSVLMDVEGSSDDIRELMRRIESAMEERIDSIEVEQHPPRGTEAGFRIAY